MTLPKKHSEAEQSQAGEKIEQSNRHPKKPKKAMWLKKLAKSTQSIKDKNCQPESSQNIDYKSCFQGIPKEKETKEVPDVF